MSEPAHTDPLALVALPIDPRSTAGTVQLSVLEASGLPFLVKGKYDWRGPGRVMVARKHYEEAMQVLEAAPRAGPVLVQKQEGSRKPAPLGINRLLPWLGALFAAWLAYGILKAYF